MLKEVTDRCFALDFIALALHDYLTGFGQVIWMSNAGAKATPITTSRVPHCDGIRSDSLTVFCLRVYFSILVTVCICGFHRIFSLGAVAY